MAKIKYQHYVPKFYLEGFADLKGVVWVFDKFTGRVFASKPERIAREKYFYDVPKLESSLGLDQPLEKAFWPHESEAARVITYLDWAIFEDEFPRLHQNNRQVLAMHIALQILRVPKYRQLMHNSIRSIDDKSLEPLKRMVDDDERMVHALTFMNDQAINELARMLAGQIWLFARNITDLPFYSSDNPVLFKTKDNKFWTTPKQPIERGIQIVFPLSPDCILYVMEKTYWSSVEPFDGKISPVEFTEFMVDHENSGQVGMCKRFIFSCRNDFSFAKKYCEAHPETCNASNAEDRSDHSTPSSSEI